VSATCMLGGPRCGMHMMLRTGASHIDQRCAQPVRQRLLGTTGSAQTAEMQARKSAHGGCMWWQLGEVAGPCVGLCVVAHGAQEQTVCRSCRA
jgi:hypothetical protein